jgi:DNA-binding transcriptional regulator YdaS (Cro superfamily)
MGCIAMILKEWLAQADPVQRLAVAKAAGTSIGYLYQLAGGHRRSSADKAIAIEHATMGLVPRESISHACRSCEFAKRCRG